MLSNGKGKPVRFKRIFCDANFNWATDVKKTIKEVMLDGARAAYDYLSDVSISAHPTENGKKRDVVITVSLGDGGECYETRFSLLSAILQGSCEVGDEGLLDTATALQEVASKIHVYVQKNNFENTLVTACIPNKHWKWLKSRSDQGRFLQHAITSAVEEAMAMGIE